LIKVPESDGKGLGCPTGKAAECSMLAIRSGAKRVVDHRNKLGHEHVVQRCIPAAVN
jgi:hypothetical protein